MAGFTIPDLDVAAFEVQSHIFNADVEVLRLGLAGYRVEGGLAVTEQGTPDLTVHVAAGLIRAAGPEVIAVDADDLTVPAPEAAEIRLDLVSVSGAGVPTYTAGTPGGLEDIKPPAIPAGHVPLAFVVVPPAALAIENEHIVDKRYTLALTGLLTYQDHGDTGAAEPVDVSLADIHRLVATAATVTVTITGWPDAGTPWLARLVLVQDDPGGRDWALPAELDWGTAGEPDWTSRPADHTDVVDLFSVDGGATIQASIPGRAGPAGADGTNGSPGATGAAGVGGPTVHGTVNGPDGATLAGTGFSAVRTGLGLYTITFDEPFDSAPRVVAGLAQVPTSICVVDVTNVATTGFDVEVIQPGTSRYDFDFSFIAIGLGDTTQSTSGVGDRLYLAANYR